MQATPKVDLTVTALAKEQLILQNKQLQQSEDRGLVTWLWNNAAAIVASFLSTLVVVIGALIGFWQWRTNRNDTLTKELKDRQEAQDKELRDRAEQRQKDVVAQDKELKDRKETQKKELRERAEERFQAAITALGSENQATQVGGAILLRSFLNPDDKDIYGRYYTQIFDLAVAYLRPPNTSHLTEGHDSPALLTPLRQALVSVLKEVFPPTRDLPEQSSQSLDASFIHLDRAYLAKCDLGQAYMRKATFRSASLYYAKLTEANLYDTDFSSLPESSRS